MIPNNKKLAIARLLSFYRYEDVLEDAEGYTDAESNVYSFATGFLSNALSSVDAVSGEPIYPNVYKALVLAGVDGSDAQSMNVSFENAFTANKAMRNLSLELSMILANSTPNDIDESKPFDASFDYSIVYNSIAKALETRFGSNLHKIAEAYFNTDYKPLDNYSMVELETPKRTFETNHKENTNLKTTTENDASAYGFNTTDEDGVPVSKSGGSSTTSGNDIDNNTYTKVEEGGTKKLERSGNIGVVSSQQMLQSEIELRRYSFIEYVYQCLSKIMFSSLYR